MGDRPQRRSEGIVSERVDDDLVIYDQESHQAHSLAGAAVSVWDQCDGSLSVEEIGRAVGIQSELVEQALAELSRCGLLDEGPVLVRDYSRREAAVRFAKVGGAAFMAPMIYSVVIAAPASALSCKPNGVVDNACTASSGQKAADPNCCSGECFSGTNTGKICVSGACAPNGIGCLIFGDCCSGRCVLLFCVN